MISSVREVWRRLRAPRPPQVRPDGPHEILQSIRWMHQEHVQDLGRLGYSPKEAFWLDFACLPFLPWNASAPGSIELSTVLDVYADLYHLTVGPPESDGESFTALLRQRYDHVRRLVVASGGLHHDGARIDASGWTNSGQQKWALAGLIVLWTARQWQQHPSAFPCRLVED